MYPGSFFPSTTSLSTSTHTISELGTSNIGSSNSFSWRVKKQWITWKTEVHTKYLYSIGYQSNSSTQEILWSPYDASGTEFWKVNVKAFIFFILKQLLTKFGQKSFYKGKLLVCSSAYLGHLAPTKIVLSLCMWSDAPQEAFLTYFITKGGQLVVLNLKMT